MEETQPFRGGATRESQFGAELSPQCWVVLGSGFWVLEPRLSQYYLSTFQHEVTAIPWGWFLPATCLGGLEACRVSTTLDL